MAALTVQIKDGGGPNALLLPSVGAKMGVRGTTTSGGVFNVDPTTVTAVNINAATGGGTISYALTNANIAVTADAGALVVQPYETPDLVSQGSTSIPIALIFTPDESDNSRSLYAEAKWTGTIPTTATVVLQVANVDDDSRYAVLQNDQGNAPGAVVIPSDALATVAASAVTECRDAERSPIQLHHGQVLARQGARNDWRRRYDRPCSDGVRIMSILRRDDTVQTAQGGAVAGTQVYYLTQTPANTTALTPLAIVYSDLEGDPGANPQITDGFGHAVAHLDNSQLYTIVWVSPVIEQIVYTDQNVGNAVSSLSVSQQALSGTIDGTNGTFTITVTLIQYCS